MTMPDDRASAGFLAVIIMLYVSFWVVPVVVITRPFCSEQRQKRFIWAPICIVTGHRWADAHDYGVEPICLDCRKVREVSEA